MNPKWMVSPALIVPGAYFAFIASSAAVPL